jgi:hypothetical protein
MSSLSRPFWLPRHGIPVVDFGRQFSVQVMLCHSSCERIRISGSSLAFPSHDLRPNFPILARPDPNLRSFI